jgi:hypothetical protein
MKTKKRERVPLRWAVRDQFGALWSLHVSKTTAEREANFYSGNRVVRMRKIIREA